MWTKHLPGEEAGHFAGGFFFFFWVFAEKRGMMKSENVRFCFGSVGADKNSPHSSGCFCLASPYLYHSPACSRGPLLSNPCHSLFFPLSLVPIFACVHAPQPCLHLYLCLRVGFAKTGEVSSQSAMATAALLSFCLSVKDSELFFTYLKTWDFSPPKLFPSKLFLESGWEELSLRPTPGMEMFHFFCMGELPFFLSSCFS